MLFLSVCFLTTVLIDRFNIFKKMKEHANIGKFSQETGNFGAMDMHTQKIMDYIYDEYGAEPERLWEKFPDCAVFRHKGNRKWFGVIAKVPKKTLGLDGDGKVNILNVKCAPGNVYLLRQDKGILPAWHMNKEHWISLLVETLPENMIVDLVDASFKLTA